MAVDTTPIQAIYDRLSQVSAFHPGTTEIFDDFLQEAGDIISLVSGSDTFNFPIFAQHMKWTGSMLTSMESTGNETRNELPPLQRRAKNRGYGAGQRITEQGVIYETEFIKTNRVIGMEARAMGVLLDANGNPMVDPNDPNEFLYDTTSSTGAKIYSNLSLAANRASLVSAINDQSGAQISGSKIDLSAQGTVLVQAINARDPSSTLIKLEAAQIELSGYVKATEISAEIATIDALTSSTGYIGNIKASAINASGNITAAGAVIGSGLYIGTAAPYTSVSDAVKSIIVDPAPPAGKIGFKYNTLGDSTYQAINFNIADTQTYQDGVSAATYAGKNSVTISNTLSWTTTPSSGISTTQNAVTVSTSGRTTSGGAASESTKTINLYSQSSTSGLTATFYVTQSDSMDGNRIIKRTTTCSDANLLAENIKNGVTIFGVTGTYQGGSGSYADGWNDLVEAADTSSYVQYSGYNSVSSSLTKSNGTIDGYIWLKDYSGTWQRRRHLTVSYPNDSYNKSVTLTYKGSVNGVYTYTTSTYVSGLTTNARYTVHFNA